MKPQGIGHCSALAEIVKASDKFELVVPPTLALLVFRLKAPSDVEASDEGLNALNDRLYARLDARYDVFLTRTLLKSIEREISCIRFAMGGINTTLKDVQETWRIIEDEGRQVLSEWKMERGVAK
jgi:aromatic-L-amino-acid decarboxylase